MKILDLLYNNNCINNNKTLCCLLLYISIIDIQFMAFYIIYYILIYEINYYIQYNTTTKYINSIIQDTWLYVFLFISCCKDIMSYKYSILYNLPFDICIVIICNYMSYLSVINYQDDFVTTTIYNSYSFIYYIYIIPCYLLNDSLYFFDIITNKIYMIYIINYIALQIIFIINYNILEEYKNILYYIFMFIFIILTYLLFSTFIYYINNKNINAIIILLFEISIIINEILYLMFDIYDNYIEYIYNIWMYNYLENDNINLADCCVCYEKIYFKLQCALCNNVICYDCYEKIHNINDKCPMCRIKLQLTQ